MPVRKRTYRRKQSRKYKKRTWPKYKYKPVGNLMSINRKLCYTDLRQVSIAPSTNDVRVWCLNGMYDTDVTGTGAQPMYYDQYSAFYSRYRVFGAKVEVLVSSSASTTDLYYPEVLVVPYVDAIPAYATLETGRQSPYAVSRMYIPGQNMARISKYYSVAKLFGVSKKMVHYDDVFQALTNAIPGRPLYLQVWVRNNTGGSTSITTSVQIKITFYARFESPKIPDAS